MSFVKHASKVRSSVSDFIKDATSGSGIKYKAERGKTHHIYLMPSFYEENTVDGKVKIKGIDSRQGSIHEWTDAEGNYGSCVCLSGIVIKDEDGNLLNDGTCPLCDRVNDGFDIANYRIELEMPELEKYRDDEKIYKERVKEMRRRIFGDMRMKSASERLYMLIAQFKTKSGEKGKLEYSYDDDGLPLFDIKVFKMTSTRAEKLETQLQNAGLDVGGSELKISYPDLGDSDEQRMGSVSQSTFTPCLGNKINMCEKYAGLEKKIAVAAEDFQWDSIDKVFTEWKGMTTEAARVLVNHLFKDWDRYQLELKENPDAVYLEYGKNKKIEKSGKDVGDKEEDKSGLLKIKGGTLPSANELFSDEDEPDISGDELPL